MYDVYFQANIAAVLVRGKVYLTQDDFVTLNWLPAPVEIDHDLRIIGISLMYNYLAVLSDQHEIFYMPADQAKFKKFPGESCDQNKTSCCVRQDKTKQ